MAHKTLIGGTAYEITGGKTLIDGTAYSIASGKTLIGGTAYEVGFDDGMRTLTLTFNDASYGRMGDGYYANATIDGVTYSSDTTIEVPVGTVVTLKARSESSTGARAWVEINGEFYDGGSYGLYTHEYTVTKDAAIHGEVEEVRNSGSYYHGYITITEE